MACSQIFASHTVVVEGISVESGVSDQPLSDIETIQGAKLEPRLLWKPGQMLIMVWCYALGIEGGAQQIGDRWFEAGWIAVLDHNGQIGLGSSGRYELSEVVMKKLLAGQELADVIDELSGLHDVRSHSGAMGLVTNELVPRDAAYVPGIIFAFGPFVSDKFLWI
ncbi:inosine/xanthosine triphosphatase [Batrachochytrium salamandrivorans]|nr:inosine/xanthosine triphosphatase [Batrachochytrium salamandrivorans]